MKRYSVILTLALTVTAAGGGWWLGTKTRDTSATGLAPSERKVLYYQSPMHPWIKSDKPGNCTICGMALAPVLEGEKGFETKAGLVTLNEGSVTVIGVKTDTVAVRPLARSLRVAGMIDDDESRHRILSAWSGGRVERLFVNFVGAEVHEGAPLLSLYSPELLSLQREFLQIVKGGDLTASALAPARRRLEKLGMASIDIDELIRTGEPSQSLLVRAPISGTVVARSIFEGQQVNEGDTLFELGDFSTMWFLFDAYEQDIPWLSVGLSVELSTKVLPGRTLTGPISFIDPNFKEMSRSTKVRVEIPNPLIGEGKSVRRELPHGVLAEGLVHLSAPEVLTVPRSAVLDSGKGPLAYVDLGKGAYAQRRITTGRTGDVWVEVLSGLKEGEQVVTQGALLIDAQSQLDYHPGPVEITAPPTEPKAGPTISPSVEITPESLKALATIAAEAADLLAADKGAAYLDLIPRLQSVSAGHTGLPALKAGASLKESRDSFEAWSTAVADLVRPHAAHLGLKVFECSMSPVLGTGRWLQKDSRANNPFFGAEMPHCGDELPSETQ